MLLTSHFDNSIYADISRKSHPEFTVAGRDLSGARPLPVSHPSYLERDPAGSGTATCSPALGSEWTDVYQWPVPIDRRGSRGRDEGTLVAGLGISGEGVPGGGAVDGPEEVTVDPVPEEDAERQLPAEARAEEARVMRDVDGRHPPGGTDDREDGAVEESLNKIPEDGVAHRDKGVEEQREQQGEKHPISEMRQLAHEVCRRRGSGADSAENELAVHHRPVQARQPEP